MGSLDKPSTDNNISDKNIKTVIFFIAIIFLGVVFFLGGGVPVILAFFVFVYVGLSLRKQFSGKHESSVDVSGKKEETLVSASSTTRCRSCPMDSSRRPPTFRADSSSVSPSPACSSRTHLSSSWTSPPPA